MTRANSLGSKLVVNRWLLSLFGVSDFQELAIHLRDEALVGLDNDNIHRFHHALVLHVRVECRPELPDELLLGYDQNIVSHLGKLNERRVAYNEPPIQWKYFQYLSLLFIEIYLDRCLRDPDSLLRTINAYMSRQYKDGSDNDRIVLYDESSDAWSQLNKVALWMATGSGKTLVMHCNVLQFGYYLEKYRSRRTLNRIVLLTPNEGLSQQHLEEFRTAGIDAELFRKDGPGLFAGRAVEILDINKLRDEMGAKTVAVDAFEGNNLVLVDEGHRGTSGGEDGAWIRFRNQICAKGFSFEYSATFGQSVKSNKALTDVYAKSIVVDYSYRHFYRDGFGKDYQILNLDDAIQAGSMELYLVGCVLAFYQQQRLFRECRDELRPFQIEKPLWVFVGSRVTAGLAMREASDIINILTFLSRFVVDREGSISRIERVLNEGLVSTDGTNVFAKRFAYLNGLGCTATDILDDMLSSVFNASTGGALHIDNLRNARGELALRIGVNVPFGVVYVGDDVKLLARCKEAGLLTGEREFAESLFDGLNYAESTVNLLIGAKKFTEGWNSWRVSTMGLMNVGRGEGAQIIQLFGRGVRLKGFAMGLKRSAAVSLPTGVTRPKFIGLVETLNVFGINADYMRQFREYLEDEGLPGEKGQIESAIPVIENLGNHKLKTIRVRTPSGGVALRTEDAFKEIGPTVGLDPSAPTWAAALNSMRRSPVTVNWYPKIDAMRAESVPADVSSRKLTRLRFSRRHVAFLDVEQLYYELERFKYERGWFNLNLSRAGIAALLEDVSWYHILIPSAELAFDGIRRLRLWQDIARSVLIRGAEQYYRFHKAAWELPRYEYADLDPEDPNLLGARASGYEEYYRILSDENDTEIRDRVGALKKIVEDRAPQAWNFRGVNALWFSQHLFEPLLSVDQRSPEIRIVPVPLDGNERQFVEDVKSFFESERAKDGGGLLNGKELFLLRNLSKGRGIGFFEAGNFHPDFILWLVVAEVQHIIFVDPKGVRNIGPGDSKVLFSRTIKELEAMLGDGNVILDSFLISNTPLHEVQQLWGLDEDALTALHVLFRKEDGRDHIKSIFETVCLSTAVTQ